MIEQIEVIKWDVKLNKKLNFNDGSNGRLVASFIGNMLMIENTNVYLNGVFGLWDWKNMKSQLKDFVQNYCKKQKVKVTGEILGYVTKNTDAHKFPKKQKLIKIKDNSVEVFNVEININAKII